MLTINVAELGSTQFQLVNEFCGNTLLSQNGITTFYLLHTCLVGGWMVGWEDELVSGKWRSKID